MLRSEEIGTLVELVLLVNRLIWQNLQNIRRNTISAKQRLSLMTPSALTQTARIKSG